MAVWLKSWRERRAPWMFVLPAALVALATLVPLAYLILQALDAEGQALREILWRRRNLILFWNTLRLVVGVLLVAAVIAFPLAWLTARTRLPWRWLVTMVGVLPLAIPGYVMAYALLGLGGNYGALAQWTGWAPPRLSGYWGAVFSIGLYTFPYLFLNLRTALMGMDPAQEDAARCLGAGSLETFFRVTLPQLRPAILAGSLIIGLYVLGDFGAVALMRFETFSQAIYTQYALAYDAVYASWLALLLLVFTGAVLVMEARLLRRTLLHKVGSGNRGKLGLLRLGWWAIPAWFFIGSVFLASVLVPVATIVSWLFQYPEGVRWVDAWSALRGSLTASVPAAFIAGALALPIAYLGVRYPTRSTRVLERSAYLAYATPPLALALAFTLFTYRFLPGIYQTLPLLIGVCALRYMAESVGPIRSALYQASPRMEEAARTLGCTPLAAFFRVIFPLVVKGLGVGTALVFLSVMKELPLTFLLSPLGFETLALNVWNFANEAMYAEAAPYALMLLVISLLFVGLLLFRERST